MIENILFRGKVVRHPDWTEMNGTWAVGFFVNAIDENPDPGKERIPEIISMKANHIYTGEYSFYETFEVEPDTVSQWTGAVDKNGKMIFVGDILSINNSKERNGLGLEVVYKDFQFGCVTRNIEGFEYYWHRLENIPEKYEVIGNIWDNPELLKRG